MNGIGGRTVAEAQRHMTYAEFLDWCAFRRQRGTLHTGMRLEEGVARVLQHMVAMRSKQGTPPPKLSDFMPHADEPELTLDEAMASWG